MEVPKVEAPREEEAHRLAVEEEIAVVDLEEEGEVGLGRRSGR